ncbi:SufE-like protein [Vigna angularis]|uniref:SufE-like protein n=1 Tax=Phaseolus angularis TaxID=3914 RepID=A0A8T0JLZ5_PHAAN|nr:SufE-like protein [Vigna angularis]
MEAMKVLHDREDNPSLPLPQNPAFPSSIRKTLFSKSITFQRLPSSSPLPPPPSSSSSSSNSLQPIEDLPPKLQEIVHLFQSVCEPKAKYEQLLFYGKNLKPLEPHFKTNATRSKVASPRSGSEPTSTPTATSSTKLTATLSSPKASPCCSFRASRVDPLVKSFGSRRISSRCWVAVEPDPLEEQWVFEHA